MASGIGIIHQIPSASEKTHTDVQEKHPRRAKMLEIVRYERKVDFYDFTSGKVN